MESRKQQQQKCRIRVSAAACGPAMWLRATLPGLFTGQTDPHGQLTTDEMGDPAEHVRRTVHGRIRSSLRGHASGGERYVGAVRRREDPEQRGERGGGHGGWSRVAGGSQHGVPLEKATTGRRRQEPPPAQFTAVPSASERLGRSAAGGRPAGRRVSSSDPSGPPPSSPETLPASRQQGVHRTLLQSKPGVSRRRQQTQGPRSTLLSLQGAQAHPRTAVHRCSWARHACERRQSKPQKRGHSSPCICHLLHCVLVRIPYHPLTHGQRSRLGKSGWTW